MTGKRELEILHLDAIGIKKIKCGKLKNPGQKENVGNSKTLSKVKREGLISPSGLKQSGALRKP